MNYAFIAYENALGHLREQVDKEYPNYASNLLRLQTRLQQNIAQEQNSLDGDTRIQRIERRRILTALNTLTRQVKKISFIELCVKDDPLFTYLATVRRTIQYAHEVFSLQKPIWSDQCKYIASKLPTMPTLDKHVTARISNAEQIKLSYINECVARLRELIKDFSLICQTKRAVKQRRYIQLKLALLEEILSQVDEIFDGLFSLYLNGPEHFSQYPEELESKSPAQTSGQLGNTDDKASNLEQDKEASPPLKKKPRKRRTKSRRSVQKSTQHSLKEQRQRIDTHSDIVRRRGAGNTIEQKLYSQLVSTLLKIPSIADQGYRTALLGVIPIKDLPRSLDPFTDISHIVLHLNALILSTGENALLIFLETAKARVEGLSIYNDLEELQQQIATNRHNKT